MWAIPPWAWGKVALVRHSLGGIYAREFARSEPDSIEQVIILGSPFGRGRQNAFRANQLYPRLNPQPDERGDEDILVTPPPLPTTATCTKADRVVTWRTSVQAGSNHHVHNIEVLRSHIGLNANAGVWHWIAKKLG